MTVNECSIRTSFYLSSNSESIIFNHDLMRLGAITEKTYSRTLCGLCIIVLCTPFKDLLTKDTRLHRSYQYNGISNIKLFTQSSNA